MKKIFAIFFVLLAVVSIAVFSKRNKQQVPSGENQIVTEVEPAAPKPTTAAISHETSPQLAPQITRASSTPIPLIDPSDPAFVNVLYSLTRSFESMIKRSLNSRAYTEQKLQEQAKLLAVARLSQTMYEATIASVDTKPGSASIAIPEYQKDGSWLKSYVFDTVIPEYRDEDTMIAIRNQFAYFGQYAQKMEVTPSDFRAEPPFDDQRFWSIDYRIDFGGIGALNTNSTVGVRNLGVYAPFAGWFPQHPT